MSNDPIIKLFLCVLICFRANFKFANSTWHIAPYHPGATSPAPGYFLLPLLNVTWQTKLDQPVHSVLFTFVYHILIVCLFWSHLTRPAAIVILVVDKPVGSVKKLSEVLLLRYPHILHLGIYRCRGFNIRLVLWFWALFGKDSCLSTCPYPAKTSLVTFNLARFLDPFNKPPLQRKWKGKRCLQRFTWHSYISKGKCFDGKMRETKLGLTCQDQWGCPWSSWSIVQRERCPSHTQPWTVFGSNYLLSCNSFSKTLTATSSPSTTRWSLSLKLYWRLTWNIQSKYFS